MHYNVVKHILILKRKRVLLIWHAFVRSKRKKNASTSWCYLYLKNEKKKVKKREIIGHRPCNLKPAGFHPACSIRDFFDSGGYR
jgi:hypothetical protein